MLRAKRQVPLPIQGATFMEYVCLKISKTILISLKHDLTELNVPKPMIVTARAPDNVPPREWLLEK